MKHIENIVVGRPDCDIGQIFGLNEEDYIANEMPITYFTEERYLPRILVELGVYPSVSEIKRNKPELMITLDKPDFIELKPKKKIPLWILVGK